MNWNWAGATWNWGCAGGGNAWRDPRLEEKAEVPEFKPDVGLRAYRRSVALYVESTNTPADRQAVKLLERIKDKGVMEHCEIPFCG